MSIFNLKTCHSICSRYAVRSTDFSSDPSCFYLTATRRVLLTLHHCSIKLRYLTANVLPPSQIMWLQRPRALRLLYTRSRDWSVHSPFYTVLHYSISSSAVHWMTLRWKIELTTSCCKRFLSAAWDSTKSFKRFSLRNPMRNFPSE